MDNQEKIDDLVAMLDNLMESGQGHVNVFANAEDGEITAEATISKDCGCGNKTACSIPTMFVEEDSEERE